MKQKQQHCLVVRKSSEEANKKQQSPAMSPRQVCRRRKGGQDRQIPHSRSVPSAPIYVLKKTCHGRQSYSRVFSPTPFKPIVRNTNTHTHTRAHAKQNSIRKRRRNVSGGNRNPRRRNRCSILGIVCAEGTKKKHSIWLEETHNTTHSHTRREREKTDTHTAERVRDIIK